MTIRFCTYVELGCDVDQSCLDLFENGGIDIEGDYDGGFCAVRYFEASSYEKGADLETEFLRSVEAVICSDLTAESEIIDIH